MHACKPGDHSAVVFAAFSSWMGGWYRRSFPVVGEDRTLVGLVSECDLLRVMDKGQDLGQLAATDILTHDILTVIEEMPVKDVVHLL